MWANAQLLQLQGTPSERPSCFSPHSEYWSVLHDRGAGSSWENSSQGSRRAPKGHGSYKLCCGLHREAHPWVTGKPTEESYQLFWRHTQCSGTSSTHTPPSGQLPEDAPDGSKYKPLQTISECMHKASPTNSAGLEGSTQTCAFSTVLGKANGRLSAPSPPLQDCEQVYNLKNSCSKGNKKCVAEASIEKVWESLRSPSKEGRQFSPKVSQYRLEEVAASSNTKTATINLKRRMKQSRKHDTTKGTQ